MVSFKVKYLAPDIRRVFNVSTLLAQKTLVWESVLEYITYLGVSVINLTFWLSWFIVSITNLSHTWIPETNNPLVWGGLTWPYVLPFITLTSDIMSLNDSTKFKLMIIAYIKKLKMNSLESYFRRYMKIKTSCVLFIYLTPYSSPTVRVERNKRKREC